MIIQVQHIMDGGFGDFEFDHVDIDYANQRAQVRINESESDAR